MIPPTSSAPAGKWPTTHWSLIDDLSAHEDSQRCQRAFDKLCATYNRSILAYLREMGFGEADAKDIRQRFYISVVQGRRLFHRAARGRGRLRDFLQRSLRRFASNVQREARAQKRGGAAVHESIHAPHHLAALRTSAARPDECFDRGWALSLLDRAWERLDEEAAARGKTELWRALQPHLARWSSDQTQATVAAHLGLSTTALSTELNRLRGRCRHILRALLAETAANPQEVDDEIRYVFRLLG